MPDRAVRPALPGLRQKVQAPTFMDELRGAVEIEIKERSKNGAKECIV